MIWRALTSRTQEVESWERRGKKSKDRRLYLDSINIVLDIGI